MPIEVIFFLMIILLTLLTLGIAFWIGDGYPSLFILSAPVVLILSLWLGFSYSSDLMTDTTFTAKVFSIEKPDGTFIQSCSYRNGEVINLNKELSSTLKTDKVKITKYKKLYVGILYGEDLIKNKIEPYTEGKK